MPILATPNPEPPPAPVITQEVVDAVLAEARAHCAPSSWDKFAGSLIANRFRFKVTR